MWHVYQMANHWINGLSRNQWLTLLVVVTLLGFSCMRGFGSRSNY